MDLGKRLHILALPILLLTGSMAAAPGLAAPAGGDGTSVRVVEESPDGLTLHISFAEPTRTLFEPEEGGSYLKVAIPGLMIGGGVAGEPDLPLRGFPFGVPDAGEARVTGVRILRSSSFQGPPPAPVPRRRWHPDEPPTLEETHTPDPAVYASTSSFPGATVELGPVMGWRHQRVQSVVVHPVQVVPSTGSYQAIQELEIDVRFDPGRPDARTGRRIPVGRDDQGWDGMMDLELLNPTSARSFRARTVPEPLAPLVQFGDTHLRIRVGGTGLCRLSYDQLALRGWPSGIAVADIALEERGYNGGLSDPFTVTNMPRRVEDNNTNGVFDGGDFVVFFGYNFEDRFHAPLTESRFSYFHTYWLSHAPDTGRDMTVVDGFPAGTYTPVTSFPHLIREEQNLLYINNPPTLSNFIFPYDDYLFWLPPSYTDEILPVTVVDPAPGGSFQMRARWQGNDNVPQSYQHIVSLELNGTTVIGELTLQRRDPVVESSTTMPSAGTLLDGQNQVRVRGRVNDPLVNRSGAYFDWYEITYDRQLVARNDALAFNTGSNTGNLEYAVTGFSSPNILLLDITDPVDPREVAGQIEDAGGSYTLRFRVAVGGGGSRRYAAVVPAAIEGLPTPIHPLPPDLGTDPIGIGLTRDLLAEGAGSDFILITHSVLGSAWDPLVAYRESQGHRVIVCDIWEIYDQFSGGNKTPRAIQRFLTQAFRRWDPSPSYLLLGADASEDYRSDTAESDPDWVPTMMHFGSVYGVAGLELTGSDSWYAMFLAEGDPDYDVIPDMIVARIPAGTQAEVGIMVDKIIEYESMDAGDAWRKRGFFLADDQYSTGIQTNTSYCWKASEDTFKETTAEMCDSIAVLGHLPDFECIPYFMSDKLDTVDVLNRNPGANDCPVSPGGGGMLAPTRNYVRANLTREVLDELKRGHLVWEYSGHGNKNLLASESIIENRPNTLSTLDIRKIDNIDKPFIFLGYACHLVEFEYFREKTRGQSIGEELLFSPQKGAVAVMASTGYEWLSTNPLAQKRTTRNLFWDLPRDPDTGRPRRVFGEAMTRGFVSLALENPKQTDYLAMLRTYQNFGDPTLRIDIRPAAFQVQVDGEPREDGTLLLADSFTDSLEVAAVVSDDVDLSSIRVRDGSQELSGDRLQVTPPAANENGAQFYQVAFRTALRLEGTPGVDPTGAITQSYEVALEAVDWAGRGSRFAFPVVLKTRFLALEEGGERVLQYEPGGDQGSTTNILEAFTPLRVELTSAVPVTASNLELLVDGVPLPVEARALDEAGRAWVVEGGRTWFEGAHTAEFHVQDAQGGEIASQVFFRTNSSDVELLNRNAFGGRGVAFYPNPAEGEEGALLYELNRQGDRAEVSVFTVGGRRILTADAPTRPGTNAFRWQLRDQVGDSVGNGVYLFLLRIWDMDGELTTVEPQRVVVSR